MKLKFINILLFFLVFHLSYSQKTVPEVLKKYNNQSIPYVSVNTLALSNSQSIVLDAREIKEYRVSHIKNAIHVGYDDFDIKSVQTKIPNKDSKIIVYCSIGIRSEDIAEKLKKVGYTHVLNLYGGLYTSLISPAGKSPGLPTPRRTKPLPPGLQTANGWLLKFIVN